MNIFCLGLMGFTSVPLATAAYHKDHGWLPQTIGYNATNIF